MKKISRKNWMMLVLVLAALSIFVIPNFIVKPLAGIFHLTKEGKTYYCPMHPTYVLDRPGDCPICNMKLVAKKNEKTNQKKKILYYRHPMGQPDTSPVPKKDTMGMDYIPVYEGESAGPSSAVSGYATVQIPADKQQLIGVKLGVVEKRNLVREIRTVGRVAYDPELFVAQQEFISAVQSLAEAEKGPYHEPPERTRALVEAVRTRLHLLGMSQDEIHALEKGDVQDRNLILPEQGPALMSTPQQFVWVYATIYEYEIGVVKAGDRAKIRVPTFPGREFLGEVRALDPILDPMTRSIRVRIRVENAEGFLRPHMYVDVTLESDLGTGLAVPEEAVMFTGERAIVFVNKSEGFFEPREVKVGIKAGDFYPVESGLEEHERIAISGNFLLDSESRLKSALEGMAGGGHQHGG